jgi:2-dehydro-3-deoxyphosphogalactonate aldolase
VSELHISINTVSSVVAFVLEHIAGIVWPKTKSGGFVLPCRSTVLSHVPTLSVLNDIQIAEAILAQARDVGAAGGHKVIDFNAAMSADGCTTNGSQFESLVLRFGEQQFALSAPSNALGSTAEHKLADIEGGFARLRAVAEELQKVTSTDVNGCEHVDPKVISPCIVSSMTTDSAAAERLTVERLAELKRAELPVQLGEAMSELLDGPNPHVFASVAATGGRMIVSPNTDTGVIARTVKLGLESLPGFATATEAFAAHAAGARRLKLFPAASYGPDHLKALSAVLPKDADIIPVGGVGPEQIPAWLAVGAKGFGLGSDLYKPGMTADEVGRRAAAALTALRSAQGN